MNESQIMINEINGVINLLEEECREKLPEEFKKYFEKNATIAPEKAIDFNKKLEEQNFCDETKVMLVYLNHLLNKDKN